MKILLVLMLSVTSAFFLKTMYDVIDFISKNGASKIEIIWLIITLFGGGMLIQYMINKCIL